MAAGDTGPDEAAVLVHRLGGLADDVLILHVGGHIGDLVGDTAGGMLYPAEGGLDKTVLVDPCIGGQIGDQADVGAFRRLDGAHTAIVAVMHVTDLHVGTLTGQAAGAQSGQTPLVGQLRQGVGLIHELAQGAGAEELLDGRRNGPDVDEALGRDDIQILNGHALPDDTLHAAKADAELVLQQLAHAAQAAVAQMVDIILVDQSVGQSVHIVDGGQNVVHDDVLGHQIVGVEPALLHQLLAAVLAQQLLQHVEAHPLLDAAALLGIEIHVAAHVAHPVGEHPDHIAAVQLHGDLRHADGVQLPALCAGEDVALVEEDLAGGGIGHRHSQLLALGQRPQGQLLIEFIPAHDAQIVPPGIEEQVLHQGLGGVQRGGLAGTQLAVDLQHGVLIRLAGVLLQSHHDAGIVTEAVHDLAVSLEAQRTDQAGDGQLAVLVDAHVEGVVQVGLILQPGAPVGDDGGGVGDAAGLVLGVGVIDAGGADDLGDDDALGAVDDEGAGLGHQGEVAHEDLLLLDLLGLLVAQAHTDLDGSGVRGVPGLALLHAVLGGLIHGVVDEGELQVARVVGDRGHILEDLPQSRVQEPLIGVLLHLQEVGHVQDFFMAGKALAEGLAVVDVLDHRRKNTSFSLFGERWAAALSGFHRLSPVKPDKARRGRRKYTLGCVDKKETNPLALSRPAC